MLKFSELRNRMTIYCSKFSPNIFDQGIVVGDALDVYRDTESGRQRFYATKRGFEPVYLTTFNGNLTGAAEFFSLQNPKEKKRSNATVTTTWDSGFPTTAPMAYNEPGERVWLNWAPANDTPRVIDPYRNETGRVNVMIDTETIGIEPIGVANIAEQMEQAMEQAVHNAILGPQVNMRLDTSAFNAEIEQLRAQMARSLSLNLDQTFGLPAIGHSHAHGQGDSDRVDMMSVSAHTDSNEDE